VDLEVPVEIRSLESPESVSALFTGRASNVSLAGVYALVPASFPLQAGAPVSCSVSIPQPNAKQFPFARVLGKGWIVRVRRSGQETADEQAEVEVAIAFTGDVTALGTIGASFW
jgi:hypothetical protein